MTDKTEALALECAKEAASKIWGGAALTPFPTEIEAARIALEKAATHPLDGALEEPCRTMRGDAAALYSIAISLKRIADAIDGDPSNYGMKHALADISNRMPSQ